MSEAAGLWRLHQTLRSLGVTLPGASAETQPCPPLGRSLMRRTTDFCPPGP